jgi:hypothetical protein
MGVVQLEGLVDGAGQALPGLSGASPLGRAAGRPSRPGAAQVDYYRGLRAAVVWPYGRNCKHSYCLI